MVNPKLHGIELFFSDTKVIFFRLSCLKVLVKKIIVLLLPSPKDSVAQLVEQLTLNQWVEGSSPSGVTKVRKLFRNEKLFFLAIFGI